RWFPTGGLGRREAVDQTFLPWLASGSDVLLMLLIVALATSLLVWGVATAARRPRHIGGAVLGAVLGYAMAADLAGLAPGALHGALALAGAALLGALAGIPGTALRIAIAGGLGLVLGVVVARAAGVQVVQAGYLFDR